VHRIQFSKYGPPKTERYGTTSVCHEIVGIQTCNCSATETKHYFRAFFFIWHTSLLEPLPDPLGPVSWRDPLPEEVQPPVEAAPQEGGDGLHLEFKQK